MSDEVYSGEVVQVVVGGQRWVFSSEHVSVVFTHRRDAFASEVVTWEAEVLP